MNLKNINIDHYDYLLPEDRIAQYPVKERDTSKLLVWKNGNISQDAFRNIHEHIPPGSLLVFNNSRVIRARLLFGKSTGASIEVLCLEPSDPSDYETSFRSKGSVEWKCIVGNLKKWKNGSISLSFKHEKKNYTLSAEKINPGEAETWKIRFSWDPDLSFAEVLEAAGHMPLPPYIDRPDELADSVSYQTVYSSVNGSVAAPTAGLHFSENVISDLSRNQVGIAEITLHVGAGTFQPVKVSNALEHRMHTEHFTVKKETILDIIHHEGRIIPVGTTSVRTLESLYFIGSALAEGKSPGFCHVSQWGPYREDRNLPVLEALGAILQFLERQNTEMLTASTGIMIVPGYKFRLTNGIITNFHQPRSTLLLLISAWTGERWKDIYKYAMAHNFRFLSYGDSSLLF
jgi:S-adenosylmethionine:tRNA ribosyltransferase-isomerase